MADFVVNVPVKTSADKSSTTLNEFQKNVIQNLPEDLSVESIDVAIRLASEIGNIFCIVNEINNPGAEKTPTVNLNIVRLLGSIMRDTGILANNFGYTLGYIVGKASDVKVDGFSYKKELDKSDVVEEKKADVVEKPVSKNKPKEEDW